MLSFVAIFADMQRKAVTATNQLMTLGIDEKSSGVTIGCVELDILHSLCSDVYCELKESGWKVM